eukprot:CAMPEP_0198231234 /NCGR_PEP_ID=MMETSP1445-20131203/115093_1 /TAXON_ID=36898 /ORGANISM="Pyramimonas sp., Strain CCMP2087" /LENGTH=405 /DNA_ID=CAMNT_0043911835 /DNA_START=146 /DNA_END=1360 /DNA_ORIENTATION=-
MRSFLIGWLAGGLANREREQLVGKIAPAGTSWLASYIDQLAEQERNIVAEKFFPKEVPKPPSLQELIRKDPTMALEVLRGSSSVSEAEWQRTFDTVKPSKSNLTWLKTHIVENLTTTQRSELAGQIFSPAPAPAPPSLESMLARDPSKALRILQTSPIEKSEWREAFEAVLPPPPPPEAEIMQPQVDPFLGTLLQDFGYKKVYSLKMSQLLDSKVLQVWESQRSFREDRAMKIAKAKQKDARFGVFPGVITLWSDTEKADETQFKILDGQHRVGALRLLMEKGEVKPDDKIIVELYSLKGDEEAAALFTEINQAQPVKLVDMPGVADASTRMALEGAVGSVQRRCPTIFKTSQRCLAPHLNKDVLKDKLFQADVMTRFKLTTSKQLFDWMMEQNTKLGKRSDDEW